MNKNLKHTLLISLPFIAVGFYFIFRNKAGAQTTGKGNTKKDTGNTGGTTNTGTKSTPKPTPVKTGFPLKNGTGTKARPDSNVIILQKWLGVTADGIFGRLTEAALIAKAHKKTVNSETELQILVGILPADWGKNGTPVATQPFPNDWNFGKIGGV